MATQGKQLRRFPDQGQLAGVCAGIAQYFDLDVTLVRLIFIILAIVTGGGMVIAYIVMALVMPANDSPAADKPTTLGESARALSSELHESGRTDRMRNYLGIGLVLFGIWLLLGELVPGWLALRWDYVWPLALIVVGLIIATRRRE